MGPFLVEVLVDLSAACLRIHGAVGASRLVGTGARPRGPVYMRGLPLHHTFRTRPGMGTRLWLRKGEQHRYRVTWFSGLYIEVGKVGSI